MEQGKSGCHSDKRLIVTVDQGIRQGHIAAVIGKQAAAGVGGNNRVFNRYRYVGVCAHTASVAITVAAAAAPFNGKAGDSGYVGTAAGEVDHCARTLAI